MPNEGLGFLKEEISKIYLVKDPYILKMMTGSIISQFLPTDPLWIIIVAESSGGKTEFINMTSLFKWMPHDERQETQFVWPISSLTAQTLISGMKAGKKETSLILQIKNGIITFKDLTSLLSEREDDRSVIMGQLREIYDGAYSKKFGNGEEVSWRGKLTIFAASTFSIHHLRQSYAAMGERFIFYNLIQPDRKDAAERSMENQEEGLMTEHRQHLAEIFANYCVNVLENKPDKLPKIEKQTRKDIIALADLVTCARSNVLRNWRSREQEITFIDKPEGPARFAGALQTMMQALRVINHYENNSLDLLEEDHIILSKLALDSITIERRQVLQELAKYEVITNPGLAIKLHLPASSTRRPLEDLNALGIVNRIKESGPIGDKWSIKPEYRDLMARFDGITLEGDELNEINAEETEEALLSEALEARVEAEQEASATAEEEMQVSGLFE